MSLKAATTKRVWKNEVIAGLGEFVGTTLFLFIGELCIKTAIVAQTQSQLQTGTGTSSGVQASTSNGTLLYISVGMGLSLLGTAWVFYRITGGLFNPAITLALWLCGAIEGLRAVILLFAQYLGGIAAAGLVACMTPGGGVTQAITQLQSGVSIVQGFWIEALLTAALVFTVLMLAAEKHKATFMAPIGIGLVLFVCQLAGTLWTGCAMNPSRAFGPSVITGSFSGYHWIYHIGPYVGSLISVGLYIALKALDYGSVVLGQDADVEGEKKLTPVHRRVMQHAPHFGFSHHQRSAMKASGITSDQIDKMEQGMVDASNTNSTANLNGSAANGASIGDVTANGGIQEHDSNIESSQGTGGIGRPRINTQGVTGDFGQPLSDGNLHRPGMGGRTHTPMSSGAQGDGAISRPGTHGLLGMLMHSKHKKAQANGTA